MQRPGRSDGNLIKLDYSAAYLASYRSSRSTLYLIEVVGRPILRCLVSTTDEI